MFYIFYLNNIVTRKMITAPIHMLSKWSLIVQIKCLLRRFISRKNNRSR